MPAVRFAIRSAEAASRLTALATVVAFGGRWNSICELASHWPVQLMLAATPACVLLVFARKWKWATLAGTVAVINAGYVLPALLPLPSRTAPARTFHAVSANVQTSNRDTNRLQQFVRDRQPDFIVVMEIDDHWRAELAAWESDYPFSVIRPRNDNFGIALLSRHQIITHRVESLGDSNVPTIFATLELEGQRLRVVATHPLPPVGPTLAALRNEQLAVVAERVSHATEPVMVLGDLNATPWSPHFRSLLNKGNLQDSRQGLGLQTSWPSQLWLLRIPIDHALHSSDLIVTDRQVGPDIGSDHRPIVVSFGFQQE